MDTNDKSIEPGHAMMEIGTILHVEDVELEWSAEEERKLVHKLDVVIMPLLIFGFFVLQLDRSNSGNALTDFFLQDVGISQFQYNIGNQLMYLGVVLFEIPSNLVLYRVGPAVWIGCQILAWGSVATFQAFIKGKGVSPYLATRFLLGLCESGYIPAALFSITRFYTQKETSKRFAWFYLGNMIANGSGGLLAYGLLHMRGVAGLSGWQWVFIIEGILTFFVAFAFVLIFPRSTSFPTSLLGIRYFDEREGQILEARVLRDDPTKFHAKTHVSRAELRAALTNWKSIGHVLTTMCCLASQTSLFTYAPSIVASYGYGRLKANAMTSIGYWMLLLTTVAWGWAADRWGRRGPMVLLGVFIGLCFVITNRLIVDSNNLDAKFAILTLIVAFSFNWHPVNGSWMAINCRTAGERSVTMAIFAMGANASGIVSSQIFQANDAPQYRTAWTVILTLACVGLVACALTNVQYWLLNRHNAKKGCLDFVYKP